MHKVEAEQPENRWEVVCVNQEHNGDKVMCGTWALGRQCLHNRKHTQDQITLLFVYWENGVRCDVNDQDIHDVVKWAASELDYPCKSGITVDMIDMHLLRIGGACVLALTGYSDTQIQKNGSVTRSDVQGIHS